jgi:hypothetical protein
MPLPQTQEEDETLIPLWVFFAAGTKWMGGFVGGCLGWYLTQMVTADQSWVYLMTGVVTFAGWSTGTYVDINTYVKERLG